MANGQTKPTKGIIQQEAKAALAKAEDYSAFAGQGFESHTSEDYSIPFLSVIQPMSPIIHEEADAKPGMLFDTSTNEFYDGTDGVAFIPAHTQHVFVEWVPREQGGGFVKVYERTDSTVAKIRADQEFGKYKMKKGDKKSNDLIETFYVYGVMVKPDGSFKKSILAFTSTKIRVYKQWMDRAFSVKIPNSAIPMPLFSHRYRITSIGQKNASGSFFNFRVRWDGDDAESCRLSTKDYLFQEAYNFRESILQDKVKAAHETQAPENNEDSADDVPFK